MKLQPEKLIPACKDYLWGGEKLKTDFYKESPLSPLAETWELSAHKDGQSTLSDGRTLSEYLLQIGGAALGKNCEKYDYFPLLIKFIDAKKDLSVQVHPEDAYAKENEGEYGKTEMWYVLDCEPGATLYYGFCRDITKEEYRAAIGEGRLTDLLNRVEVKKGDVFFIPAGTVHAIGAGIRICEIQQNSNTTYRVYDYNRRDKDGNLRPLHIEKALEVSNLHKTQANTDGPAEDDAILASCPYFEVRRLRCKDDASFSVGSDSFLALTVTEGEGQLLCREESYALRKGDTYFLPANLGNCHVRGTCEILLSKVN